MEEGGRGGCGARVTDVGGSPTPIHSKYGAPLSQRRNELELSLKQCSLLWNTSLATMEMRKGLARLRGL